MYVCGRCKELYRSNEYGDPIELCRCVDECDICGAESLLADGGNICDDCETRNVIVHV